MTKNTEYEVTNSINQKACSHLTYQKLIEAIAIKLHLLHQDAA